MPACDQFVAQLDVVEDLAVEADPHGAVIVGHGLGAGFQVDDREAPMRETHAVTAMDAAGVGAAVAQFTVHLLKQDAIGDSGVRCPEIASNATHATALRHEA